MHRIRRQVIELELPREAGAIALQRRAAQTFQEKVLPRLEALFDQLAPPNRWLRLDRVEIDLGSLAESRWEQAFVDACVAEITHQVREATKSVIASTAPATDRRARLLATWQHYLAYGTLPWYATGQSLRTLSAELADCLPTLEAWQRNPLREQLCTQPAALQRWVWQIPPALATEMIACLVGVAPALVEAWFAHTAYGSTHGLPEPTRYRLYAYLLEQPDGYWQHNGVGEADELPLLPAVRALYRYILDVPAKPAKRAEASEHPFHQSDSSENLLQSTAVPPTEAQSDNDKKTDPTANDPDADTPSAEETPTPRSAKESPVPVPKSSLDGSFGLPTEVAGLVLLGVYLPALFARLGWVQEKAFTDESAQYQAVHLLYCLATGQEQPEEPALLLPKLLCGLAPEAPVPAEVQLTADVKTEAEALLQAVIQNWDALKNTSPDGLRTGFLQRAGLLYLQPEKNAWLLRVERLGQDLLLERIPWTYGTLRLPWMQEMGVVEW